MNIGIPKEIKPQEGRVALLPDACGYLVNKGHKVFVQAGAGHLSGYSDQEYEQIGVIILPDAANLYSEAQLLVKVKEPVAGDLKYLRNDHVLFGYLHLAAMPELTQKLCDLGLTAIAFETVTDDAGGLPLLAPMSAIAGRVAVQVCTHLLHLPQGGSGILLGGVMQSEPGRVVVLGAGVAGSHASRLSAAMGAEVTVFDKQAQRLKSLAAYDTNIKGRLADAASIAETVEQADMLVGAVLIPGAKAPKLVSTEMIKSMKPGSVVTDISVDQGGCIATTRPMTYADPVYQVHGVNHFTVTNMPGAVPRTASQALSKAILPYVDKLAAANGLIHDAALQGGLNISDGAVVHHALK